LGNLKLVLLVIAQEYNDIWLRDWVNNQGISNTLAGRNLSITAGDYVYEAVHQLNDDGQHDLVLSKSTLKGVQVWIDTFNLAATTANILLCDMMLDGNDDILITGAVTMAATITMPLRSNTPVRAAYPGMNCTMALLPFTMAGCGLP
jgi:hypothetical protein